MAGMRTCPRCNTSIGETLTVCPACDLQNPFVPPEAAQPSNPPDSASSSSAAGLAKRSHPPSLAALGGWAGIGAFVLWNVAGAVALALAIGNYSTAHCHGDQTCTNALILSEIFIISVIVVVWLIGFVATGMLALMTGVNARRRRTGRLSTTAGPVTPSVSEFAISGLDEESNPTHLRKITWAILAWTGFCALWLVGIAVGLIPGLLVVSGDSVDRFVGGFLVFLLWAIVFFFLGLTSLLTQPSREQPAVPPTPLRAGQLRCPHCHKIVKSDLENCSYCGQALKVARESAGVEPQEAEA
jgi:RNA polymerase subunit RPABC4/transcription elongation factor Spt4